jgi:hypothetical protein
MSMTHEIGERGYTTLDMADAIETEKDRATERDEDLAERRRTGRHTYTDGMFFIGHCDLCAVAKEVHL